MTNKDYLISILSQPEGSDHGKLASYIDNLSSIFSESHLWEADKFSYMLYQKTVRRLTPEIPKDEYFRDNSEENRLIVRAQNGDIAARNKIIYNNLGFVMSIARKHQNKGILINDLVSEGNFGLIEALEKVDPSYGFSFRTYAANYIRARIMLAINKYGTTVQYSIPSKKIYRKIQRYIEHFQMSNGYIPSNEEIASALGLSKTEISYIDEPRKEEISIDEIQEYVDDFDIYDSLINASTVQEDSMIIEFATDEDLYNESIAISIHDSMEELYDRERNCLKQYYGIGCCEISLEEIGARYDLTRERVRQIIMKARRRLQGKIIVKHNINS